MADRADVSAVASFDKSKLKATATAEKQVLPSKADIEAEKAAH